MTSQLGVIYLLCFSRPYRHARHYCGGPKTCSTGSTSTPPVVVPG